MSRERKSRSRGREGPLRCVQIETGTRYWGRTEIAYVFHEEDLVVEREFAHPLLHLHEGTWKLRESKLTFCHEIS